MAHGAMCGMCGIIPVGTALGYECNATPISIAAYWLAVLQCHNTSAGRIKDLKVEFIIVQCLLLSD